MKGFESMRIGMHFSMAAILSTVAVPVFANQEWTNKNGDWDFANPLNWNGKALSFNGSEADTSTYDPQLALSKAGHYKLHQDLEVMRFIADKTTSDKELYFDFDNGCVLTLRGKSNSSAFGMNGGENVLFALTGGTILVPEIYCSESNYRSQISYPRGSSAGERTTNVTFAVYNRTGATAALKTPRLCLNWGTCNLFVVSNNATAVIGTLQLGSGGDFVRSNGVLVASGGVLNLTNAVGTLKLGGGSDTRGVHFTVSDGGELLGVQRFLFGNSYGHLLALRGNGTDVTMTSSDTCSKFSSSQCRLEVTDGAKLTLDGTQGRIWVGNANGNSSNAIHVAGTGSSLICHGKGTFFGAAANSRGNSLRVADGAYAEIPRFHLGQQNGCHGNICIVENGGVLVDPDTWSDTSNANGMAVGYGENDTAVMSNMLIVASGGIVSNNVLAVGVFGKSLGNAVEIDGGIMHTAKNAYVARAGTASRLTVKNNGSMHVGNELVTAERDDMTNSLGVALSKGHEIEVLSGGELSVASFKCRGTDHTITVSNGTFAVRGAGGFQLPYFSGGDDGSELILAGTNPVVRSETTYNANNYALAFRRSGKIRFVVPEFGYVEPPLQTTEGRLGLFNDKGGVPCMFDVSACNPNRRISMEIAKAGGDDGRLYVTDSWLAQTRAALPEGGRLTVKGNSLVFTYGNDGMVVVFR